MRIAAIIVAAGRGTRAGGPVPKQWRMLAGRRVIDWSIAAFEASDHVDEIVVVLGPDDLPLLPERPGLRIVIGGDSRAVSVRAGLDALRRAAPEVVLIHDAARPCVSQRVIRDVAQALDRFTGAAPGLPVADALWRDADGPGQLRMVTATEPRAHLFRAQTPQGFHYLPILAAHGQAADEAEAADDVEIARAAGIEVRITDGEADNLKITTAEDFARAERILREREGAAMDIRSGTGFDVHAFGPGDHVTLCGVAVPHDKGLKGHSDADVGLHALTDAIYGALAEGDIGRHFPPSDPQWKGAASGRFLADAAGRVADRGYRISNCDLTLICEHPKIGPHATAMQSIIADALGIAADRVSVKATTTERLGFTGRGEGIAAMASVTLVAP